MGRVRYAVIALIGAAVVIVASARSVPLVWHGGLIDPDSFMRLVRIGQGIKLGHLVNVVQRDDSGVPLVIEWSRLFDGVIVALAAPLAPWLGWHRALLVAGVATGPLSAGLLAAGLAFAVAPVCEAGFLWLVPLVGLLLPGIRGYAGFGIVHYHIAQLALVALTAGWALRAGLARQGAAGAGWWCGISGGFALWMMPETMPFVLLGLAGLGQVWLVRPIGTVIFRAGCGFAVTLLGALLVDPPHGGLGVAEIDRLSVVYVALGVAVAAAGGWLAWLDRRACGAWWRGVGGVCGGAAAFGVWLACYPRVALGPFGLIPVQDMRSFFGHMSETQPVHGMGEAASLLGPGVVALLYALHRAWLHRTEPTRRGVWLIFAGGVALSLGLTARFVIFQQYPAGFAAAALPMMLSEVSARWAARPIRAAAARIGTIALLLLAPYGPSLAMASAQRAGARTAHCTMRHITDLMRPAVGAIVLTPVQDVPELLYRTRSIGVGSLYQHGIESYLRARRAWRGATGEREPASFAATGARFVLFCPSGKPALRGSLERALQRGRAPPWLSLVGQDGPAGFELWRLRKQGQGALPPGPPLGP